MSDSPPPAYSPIEDDPFIDNQSVFVPAQPPFTQPDLTQFIDPRIRYDYGPDIPSPEDLIRPQRDPIGGKFYVVPVCPDPGIVDSW